MSTPDFEDRMINALESLLKAFNSLLPGARHIAVQDYALLNNAPIQAKLLLEDIRRNSPLPVMAPHFAKCVAACDGVPDELLKPGMLKTFVDLRPDLSNYLETCMETFRHDFDDCSGSLLIRLNDTLPEKDHAEPSSES